MSFPCTQCGLCCRITKGLTDAQLQGVGLARGESGYCASFDAETNRCRTYDTRPAVCRVPDDPARQRANADICNVWMKEAGLPMVITDAMLHEVAR